MKKKIYTMCLWLTGFAGLAQVTEKRTVTPFTSLELDGTAKVEIASYDSLFCEVTGQNEDLANVHLKQEGDVLSVTTSGNIKNAVKVRLGCKGLQSVKTSGVSSLESDVIYKTSNLKLKSDDASRIKIAADAKYIDINADGASNIRVKGNCDSLTIKADGVANVKTYYLVSKVASVGADGSTKVYVNATQRLKASSDGVSHIYYGGQPSETKFSISGISKISKYNNQQQSEEKDGMSFSWHYNGGFKHWMGVGLHMDGYTTPSGNTSLPLDQNYMDLNYGKSIGWDLNLVQHNFHIYKNYINLCTGIGFQFNTYQFKNKVTLDPDSSFVTGYITTENNYRKNTLKASYVNVPLILEFNTSNKPGKSFHIGVGAMAGLKLTSKTKQFYEKDGYDVRVYRKDDYNLNPFKIQALAEVGYKWLNLYATYNVTPLFESGKGPELYPFTLGVRIVPFDWD